jgi:DNA-binding SARP family transcriptional activator/tetratricopeptide (TPR) repeat protein
MPVVEFRLLGPLEVIVDGVPIEIGPRKRRAVLALLLHELGRTVSTNRLVDLLWPDAPPAGARSTVKAHVSRIRSTLRQAGLASDDIDIVTSVDGYKSVTDPERVDLHQFRTMVRDAAADSNPITKSSKLRAALGLWRGPVLTDIADAAVRESLGTPSETLRLTTLEDRVEADLACGRHHVLVEELTGLVAAHPTRERLLCALMLALYRDDHPVEALDVCRRARDAAADQLGVDLGPSVRRLETAILRHDPSLAWNAPIDLALPPASPVPAQLPLATPTFVCRDHELAALDELLPDGAAPGGRTAVVTGMAGVGKTTLAVHWSRRVIDRFPDGQLYVDLRGFDPQRDPVEPARVLRQFLTALGEASASLPDDVDELTHRYRTLLSGRRTLIVLDNAYDEAQVRPLIPGGEGCIVIVTSRRDLTGLVARDGARPISLKIMTEEEAYALLAGRLGDRRLDAERAAAGRVLDRCAHLPLALAVVAARATIRPELTLAHVVGELDAAAGGLQAFASSDDASDVRAVFSWSYRLLSPDAALAFRLIGLHPGPETGLPAVASATALDEPTALAAVDELIGANMLVERAPGRYVMHDLLRAYASEILAARDQAETRDAAERLLDHYVHTAFSAGRVLHPFRPPIELAAPVRGAVVETFTEYDEAYRWVGVELAVVPNIVSFAFDAGFDTHVWQLVWSLMEYLHGQGLFSDWLSMQSIALRSAERIGDPKILAVTHRAQGRVLVQLNDFDRARDHLERAVEICREIGNHSGQAAAHQILGDLFMRANRLGESVGQFEAALAIYDAIGLKAPWTATLNNLAYLLGMRGEADRALEYGQRALASSRELGDRHAEAATVDTLALVHRQADDQTRAITLYTQAIELHRELGEPRYEAESQEGLGDAFEAAGDFAAALEAWSAALVLFEQSDLRAAEALRSRIKTRSISPVAAG